jgi:protein-S-isoprenylcysteine O-methyltransferase Ste14
MAADDTGYGKSESAVSAKRGAHVSVSPIAPKQLNESRTSRALMRWLMVLALLAAVGLLYYKHPYYQNAQFIPWRSIFPALAGLWLVFGLPYSSAVLKKYERTSFYVRDASLLWMVIVRVAWGKRSFHLWKLKRLKNTILAATVKGFFSPLMAGFLSGHLTSVGNAMAKKHNAGTMPVMGNIINWTEIAKYAGLLKTQILTVLPTSADLAALFSSASYTLPNIRFGLDMAYDFVFIVDCGWAFFGYLAESRFLGNKTKSVEPTGIGWACAIFCYPPFNNILGTYAPFGPSFAHIKSDIIYTPFGWEFLQFRGEVALLIVKGLIVFFFTISASATVSFGAKFSNLTNRGVVSRGPYAFIRHPAYTCKCIAWWLEQLPNLGVQTALALVALCCVYALRAFTEEKHLSQDPDYLVYKKKVRWAAIPGLF